MEVAAAAAKSQEWKPTIYLLCKIRCQRNMVGGMVIVLWCAAVGENIVIGMNGTSDNNVCLNAQSRTSPLVLVRGRNKNGF